MLDGVLDEFGLAFDAQFALEVLAVGLHRAHRKIERLGDLLVGHPQPDVAQDLALALGEQEAGAQLWASFVATRALK